MGDSCRYSLPFYWAVNILALCGVADAAKTQPDCV